MERLTNSKGECEKCVACVEQSNCEAECSAVDDCIDKLRVYGNTGGKGRTMGELKPCMICGGVIKLYSVCNPKIPYSAMARCQKCKKEYPLPSVKLKTWKSNPCRISKSMVEAAEKAWNSLELNLTFEGGESDV